MSRAPSGVPSDQLPLLRAERERLSTLRARTAVWRCHSLRADISHGDTSSKRPSSRRSGDGTDRSRRRTADGPRSPARRCRRLGGRRRRAIRLRAVRRRPAGTGPRSATGSTSALVVGRTPGPGPGCGDSTPGPYGVSGSTTRSRRGLAAGRAGGRRRGAAGGGSTTRRRRRRPARATRGTRRSRAGRSAHELAHRAPAVDRDEQRHRSRSTTSSLDLELVEQTDPAFERRDDAQDLAPLFSRRSTSTSASSSSTGSAHTHGAGRRRRTGTSRPGTSTGEAQVDEPDQERRARRRPARCASLDTPRSSGRRRDGRRRRSGRRRATAHRSCATARAARAPRAATASRRFLGALLPPRRREAALMNIDGGHSAA